MYKVYWTETTTSHSMDHDSLEAALQFMEFMRGELWATHVVLSVENPDCVGKPGAQVMTSKNYSWRKRRHF